MKNFSKNKKMVSAAVLAVFVGLFYMISKSYLTHGKNTHGTVVKKDIAQRVTIAGIVTPFKKTIISAPYNGYVKKLFVKIGDQVSQGDALVSVVQSLQSSDESYPLRSPLNGTVVQIQKSEGEYTRESDPKDFILRIDDNSKLFVTADAPEIDRVKVQAGQETIISASAIMDRKYKGIIRDLSLAAREKDQWNRSQVIEFPIRIEIVDSDPIIKSGMSVIVDVITAKKENVLTLRHEYVRRNNLDHYVILESGHRRDIQVGLQNEEDFEILSGLNEGDQVKQIDFSDLNSAEEK